MDMKQRMEAKRVEVRFIVNRSEETHRLASGLIHRGVIRMVFRIKSADDGKPLTETGSGPTGNDLQNRVLRNDSTD
jgi:hypothetical protein